MDSELLLQLGRHWWVLVLYGVLAGLFGLFALISPLAAAIALAWACGVMALAEGVVSLMALFQREGRPSRGWLALYAIVSLLFGLLAVTDPAAVAGVLLLFVAAWLIVGGIHRLAMAWHVRRHARGEWLFALSGALAIALGVMFAWRPLTGLVVTTLWIGAGALIYGIVQIIAGLRLRRLGQRRM